MNTRIIIALIAVAFIVLVLVTTQLDHGRTERSPLSIILMIAFVIGARAIWKSRPGSTDDRNNEDGVTNEESNILRQRKNSILLTVLFAVISVIAFIFIVGIILKEESEKNESGKQTTVTQSVPKGVVKVSVNKIVYDSIPLFMGMTKQYFFEKFGQPNRQIRGDEISKKATNRKNPFDSFLYDSLGLVAHTLPNSDTIAFIYFMLGNHGGRILPSSPFMGSILFDTFQVIRDFDIESFKNCKQLKYYYYGDYSIDGLSGGHTYINKDFFQGKIYEQLFSLTLNETFYTSVNPTSVVLYFMNEFYPRNNLGWMKKDVEQLSTFFYTNLKLDKELKALGYSEKRKSQVWDCLSDKISQELMFGKYLDMNDSIRMDLYKGHLNDCIGSKKK